MNILVVERIMDYFKVGDRQLGANELFSITPFKDGTKDIRYSKPIYEELLQILTKELGQKEIQCRMPIKCKREEKKYENVLSPEKVDERTEDEILKEAIAEIKKIFELANVFTRKAGTKKRQ